MVRAHPKAWPCLSSVVEIAHPIIYLKKSCLSRRFTKCTIFSDYLLPVKHLLRIS
jgi:hypothetical protein